MSEVQVLDVRGKEEIRNYMYRRSSRVCTSNKESQMSAGCLLTQLLGNTEPSYRK